MNLSYKLQSSKWSTNAVNIIKICFDLTVSLLINAERRTSWQVYLCYCEYWNKTHLCLVFLLINCPLLYKGNSGGNSKIVRGSNPLNFSCTSLIRHFSMQNLQDENFKSLNLLLLKVCWIRTCSRSLASSRKGFAPSFKVSHLKIRFHSI